MASSARSRWLVASAAGLAWFVAVALDVTHAGRLAALDPAVGAWAEGQMASPARVAAVMLSDVGSTLGVALLVVAFAGFLLWRRRALDAARVVAAGVAVEVAIAGLKALFARPRPPFGLVKVSGFSFPSGHATAAAMLACLLVWYASTAARRRLHVMLALGAGVAWTLAVAWSRVALGVHYFTDVLAGVGLGVAVTGAMLAL